jgi:transcriptional regulator GlxA family with amidase domain
MQLRERLGITSLPLLRAVSRMEQVTDEPLPREELAKVANVSLRHLERLFRRHLGCSLREHYSLIRLQRARDLLRQTSLTVLEVALACGFVNASHFSRAYRAKYGHPPRAERTAR